MIPSIQVNTGRIHHALSEMHSSLWIALNKVERGEKHSSIYFETAGQKAAEVVRLIAAASAKAEQLEEIQEKAVKATALRDRVTELENTVKSLQEAEAERKQWDDNDPFKDFHPHDDGPPMECHSDPDVPIGAYDFQIPRSPEHANGNGNGVVHA